MTDTVRRKNRLLVIDDDPVVTESCTRVFIDEGYEVSTAAEPEEALRLVVPGAFDVILCDWNLPRMKGTDLLEELDRRAPETALVMMTGYATVDLAAEAMKRGAAEFIAKPFEPDAVASAVHRAIAHKLEVERRHIGRVQRALGNLEFPVASLDDKAPGTIAETVAQKVGVGKVTSPWFSVALLGILAGAYIGFGGLLATSLTFDMAANFGLGFTKFMSGTAFSLGLILVVIAGAELFTGNNLMISSVMTRDIGFGKMLERWAIVYVTNFVGAIIVATIFTFSGLWKAGGNGLAVAAVSTAYAKVNLTFVEALVRAIGCNWLVCLAVWMALSARQTIGKIAAIYFPIMAFVAIGFEHSVANMYFIPAGIFIRSVAGIAAPAAYDPTSLSWGNFVVKNLVPVTIGNIIGGAVFVGVSYWSAYLRPKEAKK